jgi:hypothetical protein
MKRYLSQIWPQLVIGLEPAFPASSASRNIGAGFVLSGHALTRTRAGDRLVRAHRVQRRPCDVGARPTASPPKGSNRSDS